MSSLKPGNAALNDALKTAMAVIFRLDESGSTVTDIDVRGGTPVLRIDRPPPLVTGSIMVTRSNGAYRERVLAARYHGAQLEWTERTPRPLIAMAGAR